MINTKAVEAKVIEVLNKGGLSIGESLEVLAKLHEVAKKQFNEAESATNK